MSNDPFKLIIITGATASGKSAAAIEVARSLGCDIISADSRQLYRDIPITTAAPTATDLAAVRHHFVGTLGLEEYYSAARFETDVLRLIEELKQKGQTHAVMCGGSMMYIDAVTRGLDELPTISDSVRAQTLELFQREGIEAIRTRLEQLDPDYLAEADPSNHRRLIHALEIITESGRRVSELRTGAAKTRPFNIVKYAIDMERDELFDRINRRVVAMVEAGMIDEARRVFPLRRLNSLNTVGFKEMFAHFDGLMDLPTAIARIQKNTRVYAKKQLTWLRRDPSVTWLPANQIVSEIIKHSNSAY